MLSKIIRQAKLFYSAFPWVQKLVKRASASAFYYKISRVRIKSQKEKDLKGPFNLIIETSNFCNARCLMCPYPKMKRVKKIMEEETFKKIVKRISEERLPINKVFFSGLGEPLTDPKLISRIKAFKDLNTVVKIYTNASLLESEIAKQLVALKVDEINVSFNGATAEQYQKIMGLDFDQTRAKIDNLLKMKKEAGSRLPLIRISLIIVKENEKDLKKHLKNWSDKVDSVSVSLAHQWGGGVSLKSKRPPQPFCQRQKPNKNLKLKRIYPCRSLWHTSNIDSQGNFVICCRDYESNYILGNVQTHSFKEIQKSPLLKGFCQRHLCFLKGKLPPMCQECNFPFQDGVEWYLPRSLD